MTTGQIYRSNASNQNSWSTATYPNTAGTSGNVLTSDGTNWVSSAAPGGGILLATGTVTSAQIKAAHATPVQLIAAPGAGKAIHVVGSMLKYNYGGTNVFVAGAGQIMALYYGTAALINTAVATNIAIANALLVGTASGGMSLGQSQNVLTAAQLNTAVNLYNVSVTEITGNAANDNTITYSLVYYIF